MNHLVLFALVIGTALAVPQKSQRIVGGTASSVEEYPFVTSLNYLFNNVVWSHSCGGSLLTASTILSAAHCFEGDSPSSWRARIGSSYTSGGGIFINVAEIVSHPEFNVASPYDADISIVRLVERIAQADNIGIGRIASPEYILPAGTTVTALGWGAVKYNGVPSEQLLKVDISIVDKQVCAQRYAELRSQPQFANWPVVTPGMICTGVLNGGGKNACQGDFGGPIVHANDVIFGVTSWSYECGDSFYPGVISSVSYYFDWIYINASG